MKILRRVLLVDDTPGVRTVLRMALMRLGDFDVVGEAGDGETAMEMARRLRPDVILLDLAMPTMGGLEVLPRLREWLPESRIVVLSGFIANGAGERALKLGADLYLEKGQPARHIVDSITALFEWADPPVR